MKILNRHQVLTRPGKINCGVVIEAIKLVVHLFNYYDSKIDSGKATREYYFGDHILIV